MTATMEDYVHTPNYYNDISRVVGTGFQRSGTCLARDMYRTVWIITFC